MRAVSRHLRDAGVGFRRMWGFDSFQGLPVDRAGNVSTRRYQRMTRGTWRAGTYNAADVLAEHSLPELLRVIRRYVDSPSVE